MAAKDTEAGRGDRWVLRSEAGFYELIDPKGDRVASVDPKGDPVAAIDPKGDPVRLGVVLPVPGKW